MTGRAVAERPASVPALTQPKLDLGAEDVALPKMYIGQFMSQAVQDGLVVPGSIYTASGADDGDPNILYKPTEKKGVLFHVLGLRRGKSLSADGQLQVWDYHDPDAPREAWTTYSYFVALPEVDKDVPYRLLLTRTGTAAAKQINMMLLKNEAKGPSWNLAFRLTTAARQNDKGKFFVARVANEAAKPANTAVAETLATVISGQSADIKATGDEPAI